QGHASDTETVGQHPDDRTDEQNDEGHNRQTDHDLAEAPAEFLRQLRRKNSDGVNRHGGQAQADTDSSRHDNGPTGTEFLVAEFDVVHSGGLTGDLTVWKSSSAR